MAHENDSDERQPHEYEATQGHLEIFREFFGWEDDRAKSLTESGKIYLTLIALFFGYLGYKLTDSQFDVLLAVTYQGWPVGFALYTTVFFLLLMGLGATILSLSMHNYERVINSEELLERAENERFSEQTFYAVLVANYSVTTELNAVQNNNRAMKLQIAAYFLFAGFVTYGLVFLAAVWAKITSPGGIHG